MKQILILLNLLLSIVLYSNNFVQNEGQYNLPNDVLFYTTTNEGYTVFFKENGVSIVLNQLKNKNIDNNYDYSLSSYRLDKTFIGTSSSTKLIAYHKQKNNIQILYRNVNFSFKQFKKVVYHNIYNGVDLVYYFKNGKLKHDYIIHPNGSFNNIAFKIVGATNINTEKDKLIINTPLGIIQEQIPETFTISNKKRNRAGEFQVNNSIVSFKVESYNKKVTLIIDPFSTYIGGANVDECYGLAEDVNGNVIICGYTSSINYPTTAGAVQTTNTGFYDAYVSKFDSLGNLQWSTYYGGAADDFGYKTITDDDGNVYLTGYTTGNDLLTSTSGVYQSSSNGSYDCFILKLKPNGDFIWASYFGGSNGDFLLGLAIDTNQQLNFCGYTASVDLPTTTSSFQQNLGGALDIFVAQFDSSGMLNWTSYIGGTNTEDAHTVCVDNQNNVIVGGESYSNDYPVTTGAYQLANQGNIDVVISKFSNTGSIIFSTYFGGSDAEDSNTITVDEADNIYTSGYTKSINLPIVGASPYQSIKSTDKDAFVAKFTPLGNLLKSTYLGGNGTDETTSINYLAGKLILSGYTRSTDLPLFTTPYQASNSGLDDVFFYKLDTSLTPVYGSYLGGSSGDYSFESVINQKGYVTISGHTSSANFPTSSGAYQSIKAGLTDAFIFQVDSLNNIVTHSFSVDLDNSFFVTYPNPARNNAVVSISKLNLLQNKLKLKIYNINGVLVNQIDLTQNNQVVDLIAYSPNVYIFELYANDKHLASEKVVIVE